MLILTVPIASHSLEYDLPQGGREANPVKNSLVVTTDGRLLWNGASVTDSELAGSLFRVRAMRPEPEVQFRPAANASYDRTADVLQIVKASQITRFGFLDNEKYRTFSRSDPSHVSDRSASTPSRTIRRSIARTIVTRRRFRLSGSPMAEYSGL